MSISHAHAPPRPSTSTSSSRPRRTELDFEAALRDPNSTLFLSGGPALSAVDSPGSVRAYARRDSDAATGDRSFEEDYRMGGTVTPRKNSAMSGVTGVGAGAGAYGHVPPTPTSMVSSGSRESGSHSRQRKVSQSLGIDAEIAQQARAEELQKSASKRRSLFRSPGTASSPDLATLVKRAKDRKPLDRPQAQQNGHGLARGNGYGHGQGIEKARSPSISSSGLGTISERRPSEEKSVRHKTKGMFGRLFGSPRAFPVPPEQPVPPLPPAYMNKQSDLFSVPESSTHSATPHARPHTPSDKPLPSRPDPSPQRPSSPRRSSQPQPQTPPPPRQPSPRRSPQPSDSRPHTPPPRSHHLRQPAVGTPDSPSEAPRKTSFSDDVNGILADIGHISPAQELGLGPELLTESVRGMSFDRARPQAELGRKAPLAVQRTTSLPTSNLQVEINGKRSMSTPDTPSDSGTVRAKHAPQLDSPLAPSVRLVATPRLLSDALAITSDEISQSHSRFVSTSTEDESSEEEGRRIACQFLENDFSHIAEDRVAEFLGGTKEVNSVALRYYMQYFDMKGNLVDCFRELCQKLVLRAESQEIDRIIEAFSARFFECHPDTVFGSAGVVHTVTGAMLMLNTDLHIADLSKHMSRSDFIRNALAAIRESLPEDEEPSGVVRPTTTQRSASAPIVGAPAALARIVSEAGAGANSSSSTLSSFTYTKVWEVEAENALRDIFNAVRSERILLPTNSQNGSNRQSIISLANSYDSRKPRSPHSKRQSILGRPLNSVYSADGRLSPTGSYATSINETSQPFASIGFAFNLSHTVIKEHEEELKSTASGVSISTVDELNDDELALLGAPWAKEGLLEHRVHMEKGRIKKGSEWKQYFAVVQRGELHMFVFGSGSSGFSGGSVGGGNWLNNAKPTGTVDLMHCLANGLPKGVGDRAHCFSLTTASGQVTLFQAGTDDLVAEWVSTCNYWSARRSRHPLVGGVSNMEYGWQRVMNGDAEREALHEDRASVRSARSNLSKLGTYGRKATMPMDRIFINDWTPPMPGAMPSTLDEEPQLEALQLYVASLLVELEQHKAVEGPMSHQFTPGSRNALKARDNWKTRSHFVHTEIIKYETYVEALKNAIKERVRQSGEKKLEKSLAAAG